jgi:hypothetical protein
MPFKHNKKRNTAFLFEMIVREISKQVLEEDKEKRNKLLGLLKENFKKCTLLGRELELYRSIYEDDQVKKDILEKIISESKRKFELLNKKQVFNEQTKLINAINSIDKRIFNNFIGNYKVLATVNQLFLEENLGSKESVKLQGQITEFVIKEVGDKNGLLEEVDSIVYKTFIKKFNTQYAGLLSEQKELLKLYVLSSSDEGYLSFRSFLNEEVSRLKDEVTCSLEREEIKSDDIMFEKTKKVIVMLEGFSTRTMEEKDFEKILIIQELVKEIVTDGNQDNSAQ